MVDLLNALQFPTKIEHHVLIKTEKEKKERSANSKLGEDIYNAILACSHIFFAAKFPEIYFPSVLVGGTAQLIAYRYGYSTVDAETKTTWQRKSESFGDSSLVSQILSAGTDLAIFKVALTFSAAHPFVAFKGGMMGVDLATRSIKFISSFGKSSKAEVKEV